MKTLTAFSRLLLAGALALACTAALAADPLEKILANPAVQDLLQRVQTLRQQASSCNEPGFRQANPAMCQTVMDAWRAYGLPLELRTVMSHPRSAAALRELCVYSPPQIFAANYLCVEFAKGDPTLAGEVQRRNDSPP